MAITINTNMQALIIRNNLERATRAMTKAMERISSGLKINSAADDPAGFAIATKLTSKISGYGVAANNVALGSNLLDTAEGTLEVITNNLQRISDLVTEASNGTYSDSDKQAIAEEVQARVNEIKRIAKSTTFNDVKLFGGSAAQNGVVLQVGTECGDTVTLDSSIFQTIDSTTLTGLDSLASIIYNTATSSGGSTNAIGALLSSVSSMLSDITTRESKIGAAQNQLEATADWIDVQRTNLKAAKSTIMDADIAEEVANYVSAQILQQACATLLVQANQAPKIALTLIQGARL